MNYDRNKAQTEERESKNVNSDLGLDVTIAKNLVIRH